MPQIKALFLDIGGVLLTNGWDTDTRQAAAARFNLDLKDLDSRHRMTFDTYEIGKISIDEYLRRTVFYKKRPFTPAQFTKWIFEQSKPYRPAIDLVRRLKKKYGLRVAVVSNEGRELTEFRIQKFKLAEFVDFFVCSSFVYLRKPDEDIYRIALDLIQVKPAHVAYLEDRPLFVEVANRLGIHGIRHRDYNETVNALGRFGLRDAVRR
jgi:putative hydrolase of the HAD superfamily